MYDRRSRYHRIRVTESGGVRTLRFDRNQQSSMLVADPFETDIDYVGYLHLTLAVKPDAARTLVIGLGGGSVVKRMWRDYPRMRIDAAEIDPDVVAVARAYFELPECERIRVMVADGRDALLLSPEVYDIVIVDAFEEDSAPRQLLTEEFMRLARERLSAGGVIAYNFIGSVHGSRSKPFRALHRTASNVWRRVWTFPLGMADAPSEETRNIILLASDADLAEDALLSRIGERVGGTVTVPGFERFGDDLYTGRIRGGDVPILSDDGHGPGRGGRARRRRGR